MDGHVYGGSIQVDVSENGEGGTVSVPTKCFKLIKDLLAVAWKSTPWFLRQPQTADR